VHRGLRIVGTLLAIAGVLTLVWALVVWQWMDPFTALYTRWKQHQLTAEYHKREAAFHAAPIAAGPPLAAERKAIAREAKRYRADVGQGDAIGRIKIPRIGLDLVVVDGTDHDSLKKGPGRYLGSFMPGENRLVYIAGHRTTYLAPFSHIDSLRKGDVVTLQVPYGTFSYRISGHRIVQATDLSVLRSPRHERLILQACHPRFFASHRYLQYAQLLRVAPTGGTPYEAASAAAQPNESRR
jgi:sortase A